MILSKNSQLKNFGFTLIEIIVSLAVFAGVVTVAVGALLVLVASNEQIQGEQNVMSNLSFTLDSISREMRTGTKFFCLSLPTDLFPVAWNIFYTGTNPTGLNLDGVDEFASDGVIDCPNGRSSRFHGVAFIEAGDSITGGTNRIVYFFDEDTGAIYRRLSGEQRVQISSSDIFVHDMHFHVTGGVPATDGEYSQPAITIYIVASQDAATPPEEQYRLQTTITQRELDL